MPLRSTVFQKNQSLQLSIPHHSSAPSIPHKSGWLGRFPQHCQLCCHLLQADLQADLLTLWQTHWPSDLLADFLSHCRPCGSSYGVFVSIIFLNSPVSFTLFWLPYLVGARVPSDTGSSRVGICPSWLCHKSLSVLTVMCIILPEQQPTSLQGGTAINLHFLV